MGREDEIKRIAYYLWEREGCCGGRDLEYWLRAEIVWVEQQKRPVQAEEPEKPAKRPEQQASKAEAGSIKRSSKKPGSNGRKKASARH